MRTLHEMSEAEQRAYRVYQSKLADRTLPASEHDMCRKEIDNLLWKGPNSQVLELKHRVGTLEERLARVEFHLGLADDPIRGEFLNTKLGEPWSPNKPIEVCSKVSFETKQFAEGEKTQNGAPLEMKKAPADAVPNPPANPIILTKPAAPPKPVASVSPETPVRFFGGPVDGEEMQIPPTAVTGTYYAVEGEIDPFADDPEGETSYYLLNREEGTAAYAPEGPPPAPVDAPPAEEKAVDAPVEAPSATVDRKEGEENRGRRKRRFYPAKDANKQWWVEDRASDTYAAGPFKTRKIAKAESDKMMEALEGQPESVVSAEATPSDGGSQDTPQKEDPFADLGF